MIECFIHVCKCMKIDEWTWGSGGGDAGNGIACEWTLTKTNDDI